MGQPVANVGEDEIFVRTNRDEEMAIFDRLPPYMREAVRSAPYMYALREVIELQEEEGLSDAELYRVFQQTVQHELAMAERVREMSMAKAKRARQAARTFGGGL